MTRLRETGKRPPGLCLHLVDQVGHIQQMALGAIELRIAPCLAG